MWDEKCHCGHFLETIHHSTYCLHSLSGFLPGMDHMANHDSQVPIFSSIILEGYPVLPLAPFGVDVCTRNSGKRLHNVIGLFEVRDLPSTIHCSLGGEI